MNRILNLTLSMVSALYLLFLLAFVVGLARDLQLHPPYIPSACPLSA